MIIGTCCRQHPPPQKKRTQLEIVNAVLQAAHQDHMVHKT